MTRVLKKTNDLTYNEWLESRRQGIGSSDAAMALDESRYGNRFTLWADKLGLIPISVEQTMYQEAGHRLEDVIAQWFSERSGKRVSRSNAILQHDKYDFMLANLDRKVTKEDAILECKNVSAYKAKEWKDSLPMEYLLQVQHSLAVSGAQVAYVAALIGGNTFVSYPDFEHLRIERNDSLIRDMIELESDFWKNHVLAAMPPELDGSDLTTDVLLQMNPEAIDFDMFQLPGELVGIIARKQELAEQIKVLEKEKRQCENQVRFEMGDHELGCVGDYLISYKNIESKPYSVEGKRYRKLLIKGAK